MDLRGNSKYERSNREPKTRERQRGQSLIEMAIALLIFVPLAAGVALLGQYMHIKQETQAAAREAAWRATVARVTYQDQLPDRDNVTHVIRSRHFGQADDPIRSDAEAPETFSDTMLTTFAGKPLLEPRQVAVAYSHETGSSLVDETFDGLKVLTGSLGNLPPTTHGMITAEAHATTEQIMGADNQPLEFLGAMAGRNLDFSAKTVLLADAWDASGGGREPEGASRATPLDRSVVGVIRPLVPSGWIGDTMNGGINDVVRLLGSIPFLDVVFTAGWKHMVIGRMAPDVVPEDKLVDYKDVAE